MRRILATTMAVLVLLCNLPLTALAADEVLEIATPDEFLEFSQLCRFDAYSERLEVVLTKNIDMTGTDFEGIPIFLGSFDGQGHTISGTESELAMDGQGLFRHIAEGATVSNLTVLSTAKTEHRVIGGIAGINDGTIENCYYRGMVSGVDTIGGIAGENNGYITSCTLSGGAFGETKVGGIAGVNHGTILRCTNYGQINTDISDFEFTVEDKLVSNINPTTDTIDIADIGGITGLSDGIIQNSTNNGTVGYPHVGYNVGGIVGRQSGYVKECHNVGNVLGRKEVGGIVGQFEPHVDIRYSTSKLQKLREQLNILSNRTTKMADDAQSSNDLLYGNLNQLSSSIEQSKTQTDSLLDLTETMLNRNIDSLNEISVTVADTMDRLVPIANSFEDVVDTLTESTEELEKMADNLGDALDELDDLGDWAKDVQRDLNRGKNNLQQGLSHLQSASDALHQISPDLESITVTMQTVAQNLKQSFDYFVSATDDFGKVIDGLDKGREILGNTGDELGQSTRNLQSAMGKLSRSLSKLSDTNDLVSELLTDLSSGDEIVFTKFDDKYDATCDDFSDALGQVGDDLSALNTTANASGNLLITDFRDSTQQLSTVLDQVVDIMQDVTSFSSDEPYKVEDMSAHNTDDIFAGKLVDSWNEGRIEGDSNVGGIAGAVDFNYAFDENDDWKFDRDKTQSISRQGIAIIEHSENLGHVIAKKDSAGGIAGNQTFGLIQNCTAGSQIESVEGDYVGGIAGQSTGCIRQCFAKTTLSGGQFVAGVAGSGCDVLECYSLSAVSAVSGGMGGIVGELVDDGSLSGNYFVSDTLGGLDGISFAGQAETISYDDLMELEGLPDMFTQMTLRFYVEGDLVDCRSVEFGGDISLDILPELPKKEGYFGQWEAFDAEHITSDLNIQGQYTPLYTTIGCEKNEDGISPVLVDGYFTDEDSLLVSQSGDEVTLWVEGENTEITAIRYLAPEIPVTIEMNQNGQWVSVETTTEGKYIVIPVDINGICQLRSVPVVEDTYSAILWAGGVGLFVVGIVIFIKKHKKQQIPASQYDGQ